MPTDYTTTHITYFKKIVMHVYRHCARVNIYAQGGFMCLAATAPMGHMQLLVQFDTTDGFFQRDIAAGGEEEVAASEAVSEASASEEEMDEVAADEVAASEEVDCFILHKVVKRLTFREHSLRLRLTKSALVLYLFAFKKHETCRIAYVNERSGSPAVAFAPPPAGPYFEVVVCNRTLLHYLVRLLPVVEHVQLSYDQRSQLMRLRSATDMISAFATLPAEVDVRDGRLQVVGECVLGTYAIALLLSISEFATLSPDALLRLRYQFHQPLCAWFRLRHESFVQFRISEVSAPF